jgi:ribonuclease HI
MTSSIPCSFVPAELLAAINGIRKLGEYEGPPVSKSHEGRAKYTSKLQQKDAWVIVSDSEYVVSGMTELVPAWKMSHFPRSRPVSPSDSSEQNNGWRNSSKRRPKNLDLFQTLDTTVDQYEREYDVQIAFWRMGREYNTIADGLAGIAARGQTLEENLQAYVVTASFSAVNHFPYSEVTSKHASPERCVVLDGLRRYYKTSSIL